MANQNSRYDLKNALRRFKLLEQAKKRLRRKARSGLRRGFVCNGLKIDYGQGHVRTSPRFNFRRNSASLVPGVMIRQALRLLAVWLFELRALHKGGTRVSPPADARLAHARALQATNAARSRRIWSVGSAHVFGPVYDQRCGRDCLSFVQSV